MLGLASLVNVAMVRHAVRAGHVAEEHVRATEPFGQAEPLVPPAVFLLSIPLAFVHPHVAEATWVLALLRPQRLRL